ncbi:MAG TPA: hypothetical protein VJL07_00960 [Dehalococcoidia bacterium]|nr:hypothetical protein [Dehalococcoidia bacterium]
MLLIVAFSVGLATVLTLVSLALLYVRRFLQWLAERKGFRGASPQGGWITTGGRLRSSTWRRLVGPWR